MIRLDALLRLAEIEEAELHRWVDSGWVRPETREGALLFHAIDVARVRLIVELRRDLAIDDDAVPLVLSLRMAASTPPTSLRRRACVASFSTMPGWAWTRPGSPGSPTSTRSASPPARSGMIRLG